MLRTSCGVKLHLKTDEHDVHKRFNTLTSKIRKMRTAKGILEDAKQKVAENDDKRKSRKRKRDEKDPTFPKRR